MKLFITIPTHQGKLTASCFEALLKNTHILRDSGHEVKVYFHAGNIYLDNARNNCVHNFLQSDCTDLIFIDDDVSFEDDAILKLIKYDKDIVAGVYPFKQDKEGYPCEIKFDEVTKNCKEEETGLVTALMVPTGFMRIKRNVFDRMREHYNVVKTRDGMYRFFKTGVVFPDDDKWYGEDVIFCKEWIAMGGEIFIEPRLNFSHTGTKHWKGNLHEYLMGRCIEAMQKNCDDADGIRGWTTEKELNALSDLARMSGSVVEVGSWKGRSTKALLDHCKGKVYAVDHWNGSPSDLSGAMARQQDVFREFYNNVGHYPNLEILRGDSVSMAQNFNGNKVDMVFIDADHAYESVKADIEAWLPKTRKYICGHDYGPDWPGVIRAVDEKFPQVKVVDTVWMVDLGN